MDILSGLGGGIGPTHTFVGGPSSENPITGGGGGGGGDGSGGGFAWLGGGAVGPGAVVVGRYCIHAAGSSFVGNLTGYYYVKVTLRSADALIPAEVEVIHVDGPKSDGSGRVSSDTDDVSYFPLYHVENGEVTADYRGTFVVPVWE